MLAGPFMALFANMLHMDVSLHVLDLLILNGDSALVQIVCNCLTQMKMKLLNSSDPEYNHLYLVK